MQQLLVRKGEVIVEEVPAPTIGPREILVRTHCSCVSIGTELSGVRLSAMPLYKRALKQPHHARKVIAMMREQGVRRVWDRVTGMLAAGTPTGYSAAGEVIEIGTEVAEFRVGDRVACAGAGIANHAEYLSVPVNLAVSVPTGLSMAEASTVTLGAIALQGVRRANPTLGETVLVIGLGVLGQLTAQMLIANGCTVIASDVDPARLGVAEATRVGRGVKHTLDARHEDVAARSVALSGGAGVDAVIVTAGASGDSSLMSVAMNACRRKGRVVIVGDVGLELRRHEFYAKELDLLISCSYGPGRYDTTYEQEGRDYPLGYVRWTENRNMEAYLAMVADRRIELASLGATTYPIARAPEAYQALQDEEKRPLLVLLEYPREERALRRVVALPITPGGRTGRIGVAVVGAGGFAQGMHLPNLIAQRDAFELRTIVSRTGSTALAAAKLFGAANASTDFEAMLADESVELVIICTRHDLHVPMTLAALGAGKHVLVEKPLAIDEAGLARIEAWFAAAPRGASATTTSPLLMVGFNRRFSPAMRRAREIVARRAAPMIVNYRMNAGHIPLDHWVHGPEGGGRNIGEACHIYDLFRYLCAAPVVSVQARPLGGSRDGRGGHLSSRDNFVATLAHADGSVCTLTYTALGAKAHPKELMEIYCDGRVITMNDYKSLDVVGGRDKGHRSATQDKGQREELRALAEALRGGDSQPWPISLEELIETTRTALEVDALLR